MITDPLFIEAGRQFNIPPELLWTIYGIESGFGKNMGPSSAGALGHMQFMPGTLADMRKAGFDIDPYDKRSAVMGAAAYMDKKLRPLVGDDPIRLALAYHSGPQNVLNNQIGPAGRDYVQKVQQGLGGSMPQPQQAAMPAQQAGLLPFLMQQQQQSASMGLPQQEPPNFAESLMADPMFMGGLGMLATPGGYGTSPLVGASRGLLAGWGGMINAQDRLASNAAKRSLLETQVATSRQREEARRRVAMMEAMGITPPSSLIAMAYPEAASTIYKSPDLPSTYREWQQLSAMGSPMTYQDFLDKYGRGSSTTVNFQQKSEDIALGKALGEQAGSVITGLPKIEGNLDLLNQAEGALGEILQQGGSTGPFTDWATWGSALAQRMGADPAKLGLPPNAGPYEALDAVLKQLTLGKIGGESGMPANNFSDADRRFIEASTGSMADTPQGLRKKLNIMRAAQERSAFRARFYAERAAEGKNALEITNEWNRYVRDSPLVVRSAEDFSKVRPGSYYIDPDGNLRQKQ